MDNMNVSSNGLGFIWLVLILMSLGAEGEVDLKTGFYSSTCPKVEDIVRSTVEAHFKQDPSVASGLLRLHFHDCFVQVRTPTTILYIRLPLKKSFNLIDLIKSNSLVVNVSPLTLRV